MKKNDLNYGLVLFILLLISFMFNNINFSFIKGTNLSLGVLIFSFTYLFSFIMVEKLKLKDCKRIIFHTSIYLLIFYLIISILCSLNISPLSEELRLIFTPNNFNIKNILIYYFDVKKLLLFLLVFYFSHYIFFVTYDVTKAGSNYFIAFIISILISFILNQMIFNTSYYFNKIIFENYFYKDFLKLLTSNFMVTLFQSFILSLFIPLINKINKFFS